MEQSYILNSFFLIFCGILVMFMATGFAMLETGLTRSKNATTILVKNVLLYSIASFIFYIVGYKLMYSGTLGFGLSNMSADGHSLFSDFFFQMVFVATTASVISGAVAERMKLIPFFIFVILLSSIIYPIQGLWTWGGGFLSEMGFSDFAGSTIVHSVGGWAALAAVIIVGARKGKFESEKIKSIPGSSMPLATIGTMILFFGWFGFNAGSQLSMNSKDDIDAISLIIVSTNLGAVSGAISASLLSYIIWKKIDITMSLNGLLAGLVAVTAGPNISPEVAIIEGFIGGIIVLISILFIEKKLKIDDPVGAISVHLTVGIWGTLAVGIFGDANILTQLKGIIIIGLFVFISSFIIWKILDAIIGLRISEKVETIGIDNHETGVIAYPEFLKYIEKE